MDNRETFRDIVVYSNDLKGEKLGQLRLQWYENYYENKLPLSELSKTRLGKRRMLLEAGLPNNYEGKKSKIASRAIVPLMIFSFFFLRLFDSLLLNFEP